MQKVFSIALVVSVIGVAAWLFLKVYQGVNLKKQIEQRQQNLPSVRLLALDSVAFELNKWHQKQSIVLFYFDPHCEHCQHEAKELKKQAQVFQDVQLLWLSTERLWVLREFEKEYELQKAFSSLIMAQISSQDADKQFGFRTVPTILIYDSKGNLAKKYVGETKIEAIMKYIK